MLIVHEGFADHADLDAGLFHLPDLTGGKRGQSGSGFFLRLLQVPFIAERRITTIKEFKILNGIKPDEFRPLLVRANQALAEAQTWLKFPMAVFGKTACRMLQRKRENLSVILVKTCLKKRD